MKQLLTLVILITLGISIAFAQYQDRHWVFGRVNSPANTTNINFDFYPDGSSLYNIAEAPPGMNPGPNNISSTNGFEGWGVVTTPETGELLFYTDGEAVFDANHQDITPSGGLGANASSSQAVAIAVNPVCPFNQYYIFSNPTGVFNGGSASGPVTYRLYTVGGGFSAVTPLPGVNGDQRVGEGMLVIPSKTDPFTYWLIVRLLDPTPNGSNYVVYRIDENGISHNATFNFGPPVTNNPYSPIMNITHVDNGSADDVIVGFSVSGVPNRVFTNTFNTTTGSFGGQANTVATFSSGTLYDLEFSPGGNFIYYASYFPSALYQAPINGGTAVQMYNFGNLRAGGLKRAPDGYIYHIYDAGESNATGQVRIGRLVQPETAYNGSNFNELYEADFNSSVSMVYENVLAFNFPEFAGVPTWSAELRVEGTNPICPGNPTIISATINSLGQNIEGYSWTLNGRLLTSTESSMLEVDQPGDYQVSVSVARGCSIVSNQITIESSAAPQIDTVTTTNTRCGDASGAIVIEANGGAGQLTYSLDDIAFSTENTFTDLPAGVYPITVQDERGCTVSQNVEILQTEAGPSITALNVTKASCTNNDGRISITVGGNGEALQYSLNGGDLQMGNTFAGLASGAYTISVLDENGCRTATTVEVLQADNGPKIGAATSEPAGCLGDNGSISVEANGVNGDLLYSIDGLNFQAKGEFSNLPSGSYNVTVRDGRGCTISRSIEVEEAVDLPVIETITITHSGCREDDGLVEVQVRGGAGALSYSLDGFNFQPESTFVNLGAGMYTFFVQDELGCTVESTFSLLKGRCPVYVPNAFSPNNDGVNDRFQIFSNDESVALIQSYLIFDRWGELIYESRDFFPTDVSLFWDGAFRGRPVSVGVYTYLIEVEYEDGVIELLKGDVLLLR